MNFYTIIYRTETGKLYVNERVPQSDADRFLANLSQRVARGEIKTVSIYRGEQ